MVTTLDKQPLTVALYVPGALTVILGTFVAPVDQVIALVCGVNLVVFDEQPQAV
jgi:hypothetical protein